MTKTNHREAEGEHRGESEAQESRRRFRERVTALIGRFDEDDLDELEDEEPFLERQPKRGRR